MAYSNRRLSLEIVGKYVLNESLFSSLYPRATNLALAICFPSEVFFCCHPSNWDTFLSFALYLFINIMVYPVFQFLLFGFQDIMPFTSKHEHRFILDKPLMKFLEAQTFHLFLGTLDVHSKLLFSCFSSPVNDYCFLS